MIKRDPIPQEEHVYVMEVDNQIQIEYINQHLQELINFLRKELKNYSVDITLRLNDHT